MQFVDRVGEDDPACNSTLCLEHGIIYRTLRALVGTAVGIIAQQQTRA